MEIGLRIDPKENMEHYLGSRFPPGFLWGAATSAHQVEGGNSKSDWWLYEQQGRLTYKSGVCCEHYHLYEADFDLAAALGHNSHRLSLEWSRIEPSDGQWDHDALLHYSRVIFALRERGIEPVVTLFHFTLPAWLGMRGGWEHAETVDRFTRFVAFVLEHLDGNVRFWLTVNEPTIYVQQAYLNGEWPPLRRRAWIRAGKAFRNLARAHVRAYAVIHARNPQAQVAFAHNAVWIEPCDPERRLHRLAARVRNFVLNELFFRMIGCSGDASRPAPKRRVLDFVGLNYYTRCCVRFAGFGPSAFLGRACHEDHHADMGLRSDLGWEVYPMGFEHVLERYAQLGLPLLVTENGIATDDDEVRCQFLIAHIRVLERALERGIWIIGYLHWSLIDTFEWDRGTWPRFGLVGVDYATKQRKVRPSATLFSRICRANSAP